MPQRARAAVRRGASGGIRQRQPRPDDVAAPADRRRPGGSNVAELIELAPEHASLYILEIYPNAPLRDEMARAGWSQAPDEDAAEMYVTAMEALERAGYDAVPDLERRTARVRVAAITSNTGGMARGSVSAAARIRPTPARAGETSPGPRTTSSASTPARASSRERRVLTKDERVEEAAFTGLRLTEGIDLAAFSARYGRRSPRAVRSRHRALPRRRPAAA